MGLFGRSRKKVLRDPFQAAVGRHRRQDVAACFRNRLSGSALDGVNLYHHPNRGPYQEPGFGFYSGENLTSDQSSPCLQDWSNQKERISQYTPRGQVSGWPNEQVPLSPPAAYSGEYPYVTNAASCNDNISTPCAHVGGLPRSPGPQDRLFFPYADMREQRPLHANDYSFHAPFSTTTLPDMTRFPITNLDRPPQNLRQYGAYNAVLQPPIDPNAYRPHFSHPAYGQPPPWTTFPETAHSPARTRRRTGSHATNRGIGADNRPPHPPPPPPRPAGSYERLRPPHLPRRGGN